MVDHLVSNGLLQSLAVFLPESGLGSTSCSTSAATTTTTLAAVSTGDRPNRPLSSMAPVSALSREDVLQGLTISEESALYGRVLSRAEGERERDGSLAGAGAGAGAGDAAPAAATTCMPGVAVTARGGVEGAGGGGRVCGLLEALVAEVTARARTGVVDSNTQTDEAGRSHKENLGEKWAARERKRERRGT